MNLSILIPAVACLAVLASVVLALRNMTSKESALPVTSEWINELSIDRYRPMMRLLDVSDLEFLQSQPGYTPEMKSRLRNQRCQAFRGYLRLLTLDFQRVTTALKIVMTHSELDRPDLAAALLHHQLQFALTMQFVRGRLLLHQWGIGSVDVASLLRTFDRMRIELGSILPAAAEANA